MYRKLRCNFTRSQRACFARRLVSSLSSKRSLQVKVAYRLKTRPGPAVILALHHAVRSQAQQEGRGGALIKAVDTRTDSAGILITQGCPLC